MSYSRDSRYGRGRGRSYGGDSRKNFNRGSPTKKPVEVGKTYEVDITEISRKGDAIARSKGLLSLWKMEKQDNTSRLRLLR